MLSMFTSIGSTKHLEFRTHNIAEQFQMHERPVKDDQERLTFLHSNSLMVKVLLNLL